MTRPVEARINTAALQHNAARARELAPGSQLMAVVKANAYGHGAVLVARALQGHVDAPVDRLLGHQHRKRAGLAHRLGDLAGLR